MADLARRRTYHSVAALHAGRPGLVGRILVRRGAGAERPVLLAALPLSQGRLRPARHPPDRDRRPLERRRRTELLRLDGNPSNIAHASFIRLAATTHQVNAGQAFVKLNVTPGSGSVQMTAPSIDQAPPGYYMLFLVDNQGVPSIAPIMRFDKTANARARAARHAELTERRDTRGPSTRSTATPHREAAPRFSQTLSESSPAGRWTSAGRRTSTGSPCAFGPTAAPDRDLWVFTSDSPFNSTSVEGPARQSGVTGSGCRRPPAPSGTAPINSIGPLHPHPGSRHEHSLSAGRGRDDQQPAPTVSLTSPPTARPSRRPHRSPTPRRSRHRRAGHQGRVPPRLDAGRHRHERSLHGHESGVGAGTTAEGSGD